MFKCERQHKHKNDQLFYCSGNPSTTVNWRGLLRRHFLRQWCLSRGPRLSLSPRSGKTPFAKEGDHDYNGQLTCAPGL
eukprot:2761319-Pyramimonas_sp.AAC.1